MSSLPATSADGTPPQRIAPGTEIPILGGQGPTYLPFLLILFLGSGCAALIYEIVWFQLLEFAIGSSASSIAVLLGTFMGGLCLGSLLFSRLVPTTWHPLRTYALLELGIGILGVAITYGLPAMDRVYAAVGHGSASGVAIRAAVAVICLLPPTLLMGATLPAIARWVETTPQGVSWLGFFYGGNTVGAVAGCMLAGFYLLPNFTMATASYVAAAMNVGVALIALLLAGIAPYAASKSRTPAVRMPLTIDHITIYLAIGLSGMAALGAQVVWTRLLSLLLGATVYTFSIILAVFLVGLGIGSSVGAMLTGSGIKPRTALGWCQVLCAVSIGWSAYAVTNGVSNWPIDPYLVVRDLHRFELDLARCAWAILPATLLWGASFPLALAAVVGASPGVDPAKAVGRVYAANTVGAILGALIFSMVGIRFWGSQTSQEILIVLAGLAAFAAAAPALAPRLPGATWESPAGPLLLLVAAAVAPLAVIYELRSKDYHKVPWQLIAWGRDAPMRIATDNTTRLVKMGEGVNSSVAVTRYGGDLFFHVAGKVEASTIPLDMRLQLMLGHYPSLFHREPARDKRVLVVGCGAGVTAGTFILHPHEDLVICELEPLVVKYATEFAPQNNNVVTRQENGTFIDPKVRVIFDDARHYVLTTDDKFDIITSDPIHPWVKGAASLYTKEYFETVKAHLRPGGLVTQWVPLYESDVAVVKSEIKTFFEVFPNGSVWFNSDGGEGYDVILLGSVEPLVIDSTDLQKRMKNVVLEGILRDARLSTPMDILRSYGGQASDLMAWLEAEPKAQINHDSNLRLQYLAGRANTEVQATQILNEILRHRRLPADSFKLTAEERQSLESLWFGNAPTP